MPDVFVRDVTEGVHAALQRKADQRDQSLQQYLTSELRRLAERRELSEVLDDIEKRRGGRVGLRVAVDDLGDERMRQ